MNIIRAASDPIAVFLGEWSVGLNAASAALRIALSIALATIIGCERSSKRHSAGLRTFILLSLAATVGSILDVYMSTVYGASFSLISAAIVVGAATICVNSMMFSSRNQIKGLTTAVGLLGVRTYRTCGRRRTLHGDSHFVCGASVAACRCFRSLRYI